MSSSLYLPCGGYRGGDRYSAAGSGDGRVGDGRSNNHGTGCGPRANPREPKQDHARGRGDTVKPTCANFAAPREFAGRIRAPWIVIRASHPRTEATDMHARRGLVALATVAAVLIPTTATQLARACTPPCSESPAGHGGGTGSPSSSSRPAPNGGRSRQRATSAPYRPGGQHPAQPHAQRQPRPSAPPSQSPSPTPWAVSSLATPDADCRDGLPRYGE
jgi:hypothetical protein